ncbi:hypothetical protein LTR62_004936 [Meristemomyces frigidus]|uniref:Uncharacterized protein n=1 Tax=Meristemomyces frigidus TaxID=1508187 RepID=A0AAN7TLF0_9PEZI|nr:hypothetical protein LTR62_004936 [Meristemomyces frigidus]
MTSKTSITTVKSSTSTTPVTSSKTSSTETSSSTMKSSSLTFKSSSTSTSEKTTTPASTNLYNLEGLKIIIHQFVFEGEPDHACHDIQDDFEELYQQHQIFHCFYFQRELEHYLDFNQTRDNFQIEQLYVYQARNNIKIEQVRHACSLRMSDMFAYGSSSTSTKPETISKISSSTSTKPETTSKTSGSMTTKPLDLDQARDDSRDKFFDKLYQERNVTAQSTETLQNESNYLIAPPPAPALLNDIVDQVKYHGEGQQLEQEFNIKQQEFYDSRISHNSKGNKLVDESIIYCFHQQGKLKVFFIIHNASNFEYEQQGEFEVLVLNYKVIYYILNHGAHNQHQQGEH